MLKKLKNIPISFESVLNVFFLATILCGIGTSIYMNFVNRSFWLDEAALAESFSNRTFWNLWDGIFENNQSAPLGWLYFEKILAIVFGNTEFVLRIGSILGFILTLALLYILLKKCFHIKYALAACAFYANMPFILKYSNVFKPYIWDGFFVLLVILAFYLYEQEKIKTGHLAAIWAVLIWFSNPVCFFEGGLLLSAALFSLLEKKWGQLKKLILTALTIIISFIVYYFFWLREVAVGDGMQGFWAGNNFPLIPTSLEDLSKMKSMILEIIVHLGTYKATFFCIAAITFVIAVVKKRKILLGCYMGILITCFASMINMFPVEDRLWSFIYSMMVLLLFVGLNELSELSLRWEGVSLSFIVFIFVYSISKNFVYAGLAFLLMMACHEIFGKEKKVSFWTYIIGFASVLLIVSNNGIERFLNSENVYWSGEELNPQIAWLDENVEPDEMVYVYYSSVHGFRYKNGYESLSIGGYDDNVIMGTSPFNEDLECKEEIKKVIEQDKVYIVCSHHTTARLQQLLDAVHENGFFELILFDHGTPLWYYCNNLSDTKTRVSYEVVKESKNGDMISSTIRIYNHGETYLNHQYETVSLVNSNDEIRVGMNKNVAPGDYVDVAVQYEKGTKPIFQLENEYGLICEDIFELD